MLAVLLLSYWSLNIENNSYTYKLYKNVKKHEGICRKREL